MTIRTVAAIGILAPIAWESVRRWGAAHMSGPRFTAICESTGDEHHYRKWSVKVLNNRKQTLLGKLLDAQTTVAEDTTIGICFFNETTVGMWEATFDEQPFELLWSENIPEAITDLQAILTNNSKIQRAKRIRVTKSQPQAAAVVIKSLGEASRSLCGVLVPNAYRDGLPGLATEKPLIFSSCLIQVTIRHANDERGQRFYFLLKDTGERLEQCTLTPAPNEFVKGFEKLCNRSVLR